MADSPAQTAASKAVHGDGTAPKPTDAPVLTRPVAKETPVAEHTVKVVAPSKK